MQPDVHHGLLARAWMVAAALACFPAGAAAQAADALEGTVVREVRVDGLRNVSPDVVVRHLATRVGEPFHRAALVTDYRQLDELRLFTDVAIDPRLEDGAVVLHVTLSETLRVLPAIAIRVTDENGVSAGPGVRGINLLGRQAQVGAVARFGGETSLGATFDVTTITPGTWSWHLGVGHSTRRNTIYEFDETSTTVDARLARNGRRGVRGGLAAEVMQLDAGPSGAALSPDGHDIVPTVGLFLTVDTLDSTTNPRTGTWTEVQVDRLFGDARSWTLTLDGRRFQRLSDRHGLGFFGLASLQTGTVGVDLPEYLQYALGGANSVRGWALASRIGRHQFIGTAEYSYVLHPVTPFAVAGLNFYAGLQLVGFADLGLAWNTSRDFSTDEAIDGYGVGLRMLVPFVDVIRLDLAWGEPGRGATAYFAVSLKAARQRQRVR